MMGPLSYICVRQHPSASVSIRQHPSACVCVCVCVSQLYIYIYSVLRTMGPLSYICVRQHTSASVSIRQHTSAYTSILSPSYIYIYIYIYIYSVLRMMGPLSSICVLVLLHAYPHPANFFSIFYFFMSVPIPLCVILLGRSNHILLYMCPHTAIYTSLCRQADRYRRVRSIRQHTYC